MELGWVWTGTGLVNQHPYSQLQKAIQIIQPGTMWGLGTLWRIYYWKFSKWVIWGHQGWNEGLTSPLQKQTNKLFPSKPELGKKLLPCKSRAFAAQLKLKGRKEQSSCSSNLVIQLQCAPTRWGERISILQCSHAFPLQKPPCQVTQANWILLQISEER